MTTNIAKTVRVYPGRFPGIVFEANDDKGTPPDGNPPAGDKDKKPTIEFSPAQQEFLQTKFDEAFGKGYSKAEKVLTAKVEELQKQLDAMKTPGGDPNKKKDGEAKTYTQAEVQAMIDEALAEPNTKLQAATEREKKSLERARHAAITAAAARAKAVDPDDIVLLLDRFVQHDDEGHVVVLGENGKPKLNAKGETMSVDEFVKQYVDSKSHLKQGANTPGAGSGTNNTRDPKQTMPKTNAQANALLATAIAKGGGL